MTTITISINNIKLQSKRWDYHDNCNNMAELQLEVGLSTKLLWAWYNYRGEIAKTITMDMIV